MSAPLGSLAAEAGQLLDVLAERLTEMVARHRAAAGPAGDGAAAEGEAGAVAATEGGGGVDGGGVDGASVDGADRDVADGGADPSVRGNSARDRSSAGETGRRCPHCGHDPAAPVTCSGCPLCAALALLRGERPEAAARLAGGALTIVQALRGLIAGSGDGPTGQPDDRAASRDAGGNTGATTDPIPHPDNPGLLRIDIR